MVKKGHAPPLYYTIEIGSMSNFVAKCYQNLINLKFKCLKKIYPFIGLQTLCLIAFTLKISYNKAISLLEIIYEKYDRKN